MPFGTDVYLMWQMYQEVCAPKQALMMEHPLCKNIFDLCDFQLRYAFTDTRPCDTKVEMLRLPSAPPLEVDKIGIPCNENGDRGWWCSLGAFLRLVFV